MAGAQCIPGPQLPVRGRSGRSHGFQRRKKSCSQMLFSQTPASHGGFKKPRLILHKSYEGDGSGILSKEKGRKTHVHASELYSYRPTEGRFTPSRAVVGLEHFVFLVLCSMVCSLVLITWLPSPGDFQWLVWMQVNKNLFLIHML